MYRALVAAAVAAMLGTGAALAADVTVEFVPANQERVVVPLPDATWKAFQVGTGNPNARVISYFPPGQSETNWRDRLTISVLRTTARAPWERIGTGIVNVGGNTLAACGETATDIGQIKISGLEGGYQLTACPKNRAGTGSELSMVVIVRGAEGLYVVQRSSQGEPYAPTSPFGEAERRGWMAQMKAIAVCDTREPTRPCAQ